MNIICTLSYIPLRVEPSHRDEQVSQLLYGETAEVTGEKDEWFKVRCFYDNYEGWLEKKVVKEITNHDLQSEVVKGFSRLVHIDGTGNWLSTGCELSGELIKSNEATIVTINPELNAASVIDLAIQFMGTPYLWGGRSFMGIDCSGFVQVVNKAMGIKIPRDASDQVKMGKVIESLKDTKAGDLAFFDNAEGAITHVGFVMDNGGILHASGSVRIDTLDEKGIFNTDMQTYTHQLLTIKRLG